MSASQPLQLISVSGYTPDECIAMYFGSVQPENELQRKVMRTYAVAFERTHCDGDEELSGDSLRSFITRHHPVDELFSPDVLSNFRLVNKVRNILAQENIVADPPLPPRARLVIRLAHCLYPGDDNAQGRERAVALANRFLESTRRATQGFPVSRCDASVPPDVHASLGPVLNASSSPNSSIPPVSSYGQTVASSGQIYTHNTVWQPTHEHFLALQQQNMQLQAQISQMMHSFNRIMSSDFQVGSSSSINQGINTQYGMYPDNTNFPQYRATPTARHHQNLRNASVSPARGNFTQNNPRSSDSNVHHHINVRFKNKESKYSGSDEEHLQDFIDSYVTTAEDYGLSASQKLQYLHNLFRGDALRFYNLQIKGRVSTFGEAISVIMNHFNSADVQQRVKADLSTLSFIKFVEKNGSMAKGLSSLATYIANRTPQCPPCFRSESHKVDFLKQAVLEQPWAREVLIRIKANTQFQPLYTELANALQLHQEVLQKSGKTTSHSRNGSTSDIQKPFIYFTQPRVLKSIFPGNESTSSCWNCGLRGHRFTKCHKPLDMTRIAANKAKSYAKKGDKKNSTRRVLFELVEGLNELCDLDGDSFETESVRAFFGELRSDEDDYSDYSSESEVAGDEKLSMFSTSAANEHNEPNDYTMDDSDF